MPHNGVYCTIVFPACPYRKPNTFLSFRVCNAYRGRHPPTSRPVGDGVPDVPFRAVLVLLRRGGRLCPPVPRHSVGDGVLPWSAAEQMPLGYDVPSARQRRAVRLPLGGGCRRSRLGERKRVSSLPPSALRADTSLAEGGKERRIPTPVTAGRCGHRPLRNRKERVQRGGHAVRPYEMPLTAANPVLRGHARRRPVPWPQTASPATIRRS